MTISFGEVPAGAVLPVHFASYNSAGASVTLTGLAITDVEIYKGITVTQRSSDAGVVLIDTDGIDIDSITGAHGFSIDTGDNTDAGFYAVGSYYSVWVSSVTIDGQTVNFLAATFRIKAAEHTAGYVVATIKDGTGTGEIDTNAGAIAHVILADTVTTYTGNTVQTGDSFARIGATGSGLTSLASAANLAVTDARLDTEIPAILAAVDTEIAAILADTNEIQTGWATLVSDVADILASTDLIPTSVDGLTFTQWLRIVGAAAAGKASGLATTTAVYRAIDDSKPRITATVDANGNRTAITLDAS